MDQVWHTKSTEEIFEELHSSESGLSQQEALSRREKYGFNKLPEEKRENFLLIFFRQFKSPLIYILLFAGLLVFLMQEFVNAGIIIFILIFNALVGAIQEGRAQATLLALKKFAETRATVLRDGKELIISDEEIVPGDIIILQEGEKVPADSRMLISHNLKVDESALTGESEPVGKFAEKLENKELLPADQVNMVFKATYLVAGSGKAVAVAIGTRTEIGRISEEIIGLQQEIPLKGDIRRLSHLIIFAVAAICLLLFILGIGFDKTVKEMFTTIVSLSVSAIPEGLPVVLTLVLASGVWRMGKRNALVRKLQAVEALGEIKVIAVDKTGTITKNEMVVEKIYVDDKFFEVEGNGYEPKGEIKLNSKVIDPLNHEELLLAGRLAAFSSGARIMFSEEKKLWQVAGDPTEAGLLVLAEKIGFKKEELEEESPRLDEITFDYQIKYHATLHRFRDKNFLTVAGAPEVILALCSKIWREGKIKELSSEEKNKLEGIFLSFSSEGLRTIAFAVKENVSRLEQEKVRELTFGGFWGMKDALRPEVPEAISKAVSAGIKVVMITGDHKLTALAIAKEAGIYHRGDYIFTGEEIDALSDGELKDKLSKTTVFARLTPEHKLRIIENYRRRGELIAMTGDGINDLPSLAAADLGIAMGKIGTEAAKEVSDIVLLDDNFGSLVSAIEEGRSIYKTIRRVILYLFSTNLGEILTIFLALLLGYPLPLFAAQIIWLNFVTDGFLDVALAMEPKEQGLVESNLKPPQKFLVDKLMFKRMLLMAAVMALAAVFLFQKYFQVDLIKAWTISLTTLAVFQWFNAWNCRHERKSIFQLNPFSNLFLVGAMLIVVVLQLLAVYHPVMQKLLKTTALTAQEWLMIVCFGLTIIVAEEIRKMFARRARIGY